jgi:hypothetical protein
MVPLSYLRRPSPSKASGHSSRPTFFFVNFVCMGQSTFYLFIYLFIQVYCPYATWDNLHTLLPNWVIPSDK